MSVRRTTAAVALLLISLALAPAASAAASRGARVESYWQQLTALFARWTGGEIAHGCVPSEVDTCGVDPPQ